MLCRRLPWILELDERKWRSSSVLQVDEGDLAELVEQILDVFRADVRRQVSDVDAALVAS